MNFWMIFQVFGIVSNWSVKALADGKITIIEAGELGEQLGKLLGIPTDINIPTGSAPVVVADADADQDAAASEGADQRIPLHGPPGETGAAT